jgi:hypothetical protein
LLISGEGLLRVRSGQQLSDKYSVAAPDPERRKGNIHPIMLSLADRYLPELTNLQSGSQLNP